MGLVKRTTPVIEQQRAPRGLDEMLADLAHPRASTRRAAARELGAHPGAAKALCERLPSEPDLVVREHILSALMRIASCDVAGGLIPYLASEDVWLRNAVIEALPKMPNVCRQEIEKLFVHPDADVRIFAVTVMGRFGDPAAQACLVRVLDDEQDVNVCSAAIEALAEHGHRATIPALRALATRFESEPFIVFATDLAVSRIESRLS